MGNCAVRFQVPVNNARYCQLGFTLPEESFGSQWRVGGTEAVNIYALSEPINTHGINWFNRPKRAPNARSGDPDSPLYSIKVCIPSIWLQPVAFVADITAETAFRTRQNHKLQGTTAGVQKGRIHGL